MVPERPDSTPEATDSAPGPIVLPRLWQLGADPVGLARAAADWRELARGLDTTGHDLTAANRALLERWTGTSAEAYRMHRTRTGQALTTIGSAAGQIAATIDQVAGVLAAAQGHLDESWSRLCAALGVRPDGLPDRADGHVVVRPADSAGATRVAVAAAEAAEIRADADLRLAELAGALHQLRWRLWPAAGQAMAQQGEAAGWLVEPEPADAGRIIVDGNRVIVNGTGAADQIQVGVDDRTGEPVVTIGGVVRRFAPGVDLVIRAGAGDDTIAVAPGCRLRLTLLAGAGDDRVRAGAGDESILGLWGRDTIEAGAGADWVSGGTEVDYLDGQAGDDILSGGPGEDTLYGLDGADLLWGGPGRDYLDGGAGDDRVAGGSGDDVAVGGRGADTLYGGTDDDVLYGGDGTDRVLAGAGADRAYVQTDDTVSAAEQQVTVQLTNAGGFIRVEGSPEFVARVGSDLDALRSSPSGELMLGALDRAHADSRSALASVPILGDLFGTGDTLTIRELDRPNGFASWRSFGGTGHASVDYNPRFDDFWQNPPVPPVVVLYHELAHVYDYVSDALPDGVYTGPDNPGVPNAERVATGLPIDHDQDPTTPDRIDPRHPLELTENGLRTELGRPRRLRY